MRIAASLLLLCLLLLCTTAARAELRWGGDAEGGAPYVFADPKDPTHRVGFEVDLAMALERELGEKIRFVQYDFATLFAGLERGDFDFAMNGIEVTAERARKARFTRPYYLFREQLVARRDDRRFESLAACRAQRCTVGTMANTLAEALLDRDEVPKRIYDGQVEPYADLEAKRIDAVLLDLPIVVYYAKPNAALRLVGAPMERGTYAIAVRRDRDDLTQRLDAALLRLGTSGELQRILEHWQLWNEDQAQLQTAPPLDVSTASANAWTPRRYLPLLLAGAWNTVRIAVLSMLLAVLLGLPIALLRLYAPAPIRWLMVLYVEFFRGVPVLLVLFFLYFGLPAMKIELTADQAALLGFGLCYAAYESEIYRTGIAAVPRGQWEAAAALGMRPALAFRRIILPQSLRIVLPPMTSDFVALFKDTSLVSVVAVVDLTKQYQILSKSSMKYGEIGLLTALLYLLIALPLSYLARSLEHRWAQGQR